MEITEIYHHRESIRRFIFFKFMVLQTPCTWQYNRFSGTCKARMWPELCTYFNFLIVFLVTIIRCIPQFVFQYNWNFFLYSFRTSWSVLYRRSAHPNAIIKWSSGCATFCSATAQYAIFSLPTGSNLCDGKISSGTLRSATLFAFDDWVFIQLFFDVCKVNIGQNRSFKVQFYSARIKASPWTFDFLSSLRKESKAISRTSLSAWKHGIVNWSRLNDENK